MAFEAGQKIGDYEIVAKLGAGGLGVVYEVQHLISQRREAMKILLADQSGTPEMVERFHREVQTLATLSHANIAALHTAFYYENQLTMVMELIQGETLRSLQTKARVTLPQVLDFTMQTLQALVYAHHLGVVHRDIKPSNIMITENGVVKLLDFGIARTEHASDLTLAGYLVGSLSYMSPEQMKGHKATARSDLYSVGVMLYELLTGRLPITGATNYEIMINHMQQVPIAPHEIAAAVPLELSAATMRALEKDPANRFASAGEFLHTLQLIPTPWEHDPVTAALPQTAASAPRSLTGLQSASGLPGATGSLQQRPSSSSGLQSLPLEEVSRKLAVYIGPVAKIVVKKLASQTDDLDTIYREAAKQISSDADRAAFLRARKQ
jgi:eukaryotic-like serine/threonine-protein kinase